MIELSQTVRRLLRAPGFTLTTILTLAIGIGATTAIFSVVNGILIQPLPYPESNRLIVLRHQSPGDDERAASIALYFTYREHNETFESLALWSSDTAVITGAQEPDEVPSLDVTHEFLPTLGVQPMLGRGFSEADDQLGAALTVIVSQAYWERRLGGTEDAIGQTLVVDGEPHTVIGVLPESFRFLRDQAEILTPKQPVPGIGGTGFFGPTGERGIARLKAGVTLAEASTDVARMVPIARETFPPPGVEVPPDGPIQFGPNLQLLKENVVGDLDDVLWVLMGTIGALLLIACANVANLELVRTQTRSQELSIRVALGARFSVLGRSLLLETILLGLAGGVIGLFLAMVGLPVLLTAGSGYLPGVLEIKIDPTVLVFALTISIVAGLALGLVPLVKYASPEVGAMLRRSGRTYGQGHESHRTQSMLVVLQVALALVLLVAAGLMIRTFQSLRDIEPGFADPDQVQTVTLSIPQGSVPDYARAIRLKNDIQTQLAALPGVESVGFSSMVPLGGDGPDGGALVEVAPGEEREASFEFRFTSPEFFATLRTPLIAGRAFEWTDILDEDRPQAVIVSESVARSQWGSPEAAPGKRMRRSPFSAWTEVVGVVGDVHLEGVDQPAPDTVYYTPRDELAQWMSRTITFAVRSERVATAGFFEDLQRAIWSVDSTLPLGSVGTLGDLYRRSMERTSLTLVLLAITGAMALFLSLLGIYGVISYTLSHRTREIGIRMALGAQLAHLMRLPLHRVLAPVIIGVVLGLCMAAAFSRVTQSLLFGVSALDPATYAVVALILLATAAVAGFLPAYRVMRVDPTEALRAE
jgi:predicted permease